MGLLRGRPGGPCSLPAALAAARADRLLCPRPLSEPARRRAARLATIAELPARAKRRPQASAENPHVAFVAQDDHLIAGLDYVPTTLSRRAHDLTNRSESLYVGKCATNYSTVRGLACAKPLLKPR